MQPSSTGHVGAHAAAGPPVPGDGPPQPSAVRWRILGPVEARMHGQLLDLGPPMRRSLLALLLSYAGEQVSMATILDALWGQDAPDHAVNIVHRHVGALRRLVEPGLARRAQGHWLHSSANGYRVVVDGRTLDLLECRDLAGAARAGTDPARRLDLLCHALALWRGAAAEDIAPQARRQPVFAALDREHAELAMAAGQLALDRPRADSRTDSRTDEVLAALAQAARRHPTDEVVHAVLLRCLAGAGRRAQALDTYHALRGYLADQLGVSPGQALRAAYLEVLRDEPAAAEPRALPPPAELPAPLAVFVGREPELTRLREVVADPGPVRSPIVLTGMAGVGKTTTVIRFAHEVAGAFPDGQLYVNLRGFGPDGAAMSAADVLHRFLQALDVPQARIPSDLDARAALYRSTLATRRMLVVLDNARDTAHVRPLLPGSADCQVLITSRVQLRGLAGEGAHWIPLHPMDPGDTRAYLTRRLGAGRADAEPDAVHAIHRMSDGLPIALSLLTARATHTPGASLAAVVAEVERSRGSLVPYVDTADPTTDLRSVFSWSYDALSPGAARMFRLLALHPPPTVPLPAAAALVDQPETEARVLLEQLAEANLVAEQHPGRYTRHDLLEVYAAGLLTGDQEEAAAEDRLYAYYTRRAGAADRALTPGRVGLPDLYQKAEPTDEEFPDEETAWGWFELEYAVLSALALRGGPDGELDPYVWRLAWAGWPHLDHSGRWERFRAVQEAAVAAAQRSARPEVEAALRRGLARAYVRANRFPAAERQLHDALRLLHDARGGVATLALTAEGHRQLGWLYDKQGRHDEALDQAHRALALHDPLSQSLPRSYALVSAGTYEAKLGRYEDALEHCRAAFAILRGAGHRAGLADLWLAFGRIGTGRGRHADAVAGYQRALALYRTLGPRYPSAVCAFKLGQTLIMVGHPALARPLVAEAAQTFEELGHEFAAEAREVLAKLDADDRHPAGPPTGTP